MALKVISAIVLTISHPKSTRKVSYTVTRIETDGTVSTRTIGA